MNDTLDTIIAEMLVPAYGNPVETQQRREWADRLAALQREPAAYPDDLGRLLSAKELSARCNELAGRIARIDGAPPAPAVPEGWQLVPVEPTHKMKSAGGMECGSAANGVDPLTAALVYRAMLAAAKENTSE